MEKDPERPASSRSFLTTRWSMVLTAAQGNEPAMASLCQAYWQPVYGLFRWWGHSTEESEDLTQEFFHRILEKNWLASLQRDGGKFRSFLFTLLRRFRADEYDRSQALKRGGSQNWISLNTTAGELALHEINSELSSPDAVFDQLWAAEVLERAVRRLESEVLASPKAALWQEMKPLLSSEPGHGECAAIARNHCITSNHVSVTLSRWRIRIRELVLEEIRHTVGSEDQAQEEWNSLLSALRKD